MKISPFYLAIICLLLTSCRLNGVNPDIEQAFESEIQSKDETSENAVPSAITQELMPSLVPIESEASLITEKRFDIEAIDVPASAFFQSLVSDTPVSVALHPEVSGSISLSLKGVTLEDVLAVVTDMYGYEVQLKGRLLQVFPAGLRTETFAVDYLSMQRMGLSMTSITSGGVESDDEDENGSNNNNNNSNNGFNGGGNGSQNGMNQFGDGSKGTTIVTQSEHDFWKDLKEALQDLIGTGSKRTIVVNPQAGLVTVRAYPDELRSIKEFLQQTEQHLQRQVILEAKVVEVNLEDAYQQGINWQSVLGHSGSTDFSFSTSAGSFGNQITSAIGGIANLTFSNEDFSGVITLLETQGNVQVLSSPRLTASNNQKAVIKVGTDEYYVTEVSTTTVTGTATTSTPNIELEPFFSGIALDVTPQIDSNGGVILHVHPSVIETQEQVKIITLNEQGYELPLAQSTVRESDTVIRAQSGEIVVIGGLMQSETQDIESKVPLLGDIPWIGEAFTSRAETIQKKELVIMIKPTVVGAGTWTEQLQRSSDLLQTWYGSDED
ncbi:pilus (MSHA type) biogenesis protein MshL [Catenovulum sp. SM1970]|uniref:pilus (MSHA type) biogenesis protein MshL n=1 Tax=Marinifaba aquimaris TaxID=2741323 RepID=UPI00157272F8|nr:pilus (MSHA type) biogenesis protein MshL [Marinifaba aquimaris]NTS75859.1 pilus (MSHA type) biogenesis protein MshL [Marinifaba aquimaris]